MNAFSEGLLLVTAPTLGHASSTLSIRTCTLSLFDQSLGDLLWDDPFSGQGQDLSSFGLTEMHTTYRRYVVHKASLYSTLQSLFGHFLFLVVN